MFPLETLGLILHNTQSCQSWDGQETSKTFPSFLYCSQVVLLVSVKKRQKGMKYAEKVIRGCPKPATKAAELPVLD